MSVRSESLPAILLLLASAVSAQPAPARRAAPAPAVTSIRYDLTFDSSTARNRSLRVGMHFDVAGAGPVLLSIPAWTPGAYELSFYARKVSGFEAKSGGRALVWDKTDYDTWRVRPTGAGTVDLAFDFLADTLDNAMAWAKPDFLLVNGTNVFPFPEGIGLDFPARVSVTTMPSWRVVTGLDPDGAAGHYRAGTYHDLVDMPFFIGRFDLDSAMVGQNWHRLATYPESQLRGPARRTLWDQIKAFLPAEAQVFGETPWKVYSTMMIFEPSFGGGSALEHQSSHVGIYHPGFMGTPLLASITAHEIFHAWNVKRLRPADMVPYRYDQPEPTTLLWVSEGITDYYADLALVRGGVIDSTVFLALTDGKRQKVDGLAPVALEDASLSTWIHPTDGTADIYYDKGSLAGLLIDILIRDATDNGKSLDDVMRGLYQSAYKKGKGFTTQEWWAAVSAAAGGRSFADFAARYVDGRDPFPWSRIGPLAGLSYRADSTREIRLGVNTIADSSRVFVTAVTAGSAADEAGVETGDQLLKVGEVEVKDENFGVAFRARYANAEGTRLPLVVRRSEAERTLQIAVRRELVVNVALEWDTTASAKALRIRDGILKGATEPR
ncbi:MAG TPA: PDZ domain-containing protein [Gemmatimonadales bacterium]|nr:PDZ domain-containing protein [Gemmatimonadales bacterium]